MSSKPMAYVVCGETGEYSDHRIWYVRTFLTSEAAEALASKLNAWCKEHGADKGSVGGYADRQRVGKPPDDDQFHVDYTGTTYGILEIPLEK